VSCSLLLLLLTSLFSWRGQEVGVETSLFSLFWQTPREKLSREINNKKERKEKKSECSKPKKTNE